MNVRNRSAISGRHRESQDSKVTSTPQSVSPAFSLSPSISTIFNEDATLEIDSDDEYKANRDSPSDTSSLDESVPESSIWRLKRAKNIKWKGFWSSLKPKNKDSLYAKITAHPDELQSIVTDLLKIYSKDQENGIDSILQLFVDLSGYKKLVVDKVYNFQKQNAKEVVNKMESQLMEPDLKKTGKFLFVKCSDFANTMDYILTNFIQHLVLISFKKEVLFDDIFTGHILEFINCMCFSYCRNIRVTGIVLVLKFLTAFISLYNQILSVIQDENSDTLEKIGDRKVTIESLIDFLYIIYDKNCLLSDAQKKCYPIRVKCAQEMYNWIKLFPEIFIFKRRCIGRLMKLIQDEDEKVRRVALTTCEKLFKTEQVQKSLEERIELCLKIVATRFVDNNYKIAVKAVTIFTAAVEIFPLHITPEYKMAIIYRMFEQNIQLAKAAGKFLATYIYQQRKSEEHLVMAVIKVVFLKKEFAERLPFFMESCFDFFPELKNWNLIMRMLRNNEIDFVVRKHLVAIFNESVGYTLTGKFSQTRQDILAIPRCPEDHSAVANVLIPNFKNLILQYQTDKNCLNKLTELLLFLNYDLCRSDHLEYHYPAVVSLLKDLFDASLDRNLLENITKIFSYMHDKRYTHAYIIVDDVKKEYVKSLTNYLNQLTSTPDKNLLMKLREISLKVSILFAKFNLTNILTWEEIFEFWGDKYLKALKYLIVCCQWHLVWNLREFIQTLSNGDNTNRVNPLLYSNCKGFVYDCLDMLQHANANSEFFLIFETFCDLYACFEKELKRKRQFSEFVIQITETTCIDLLFNFAIRYIIDNPQVQLQQRRRCLIKLINLIYLGVVPVECFSKILRFYCSHYQEFGPIMDDIMHQLHLQHPGLSVLIIHTLTEFYNIILKKYKLVSLQSDESKHLKSLTKKFTTVKEMKSRHDILKLVNMSIHFAFRGEQNYSFLHFAKHFAKLLNESGKSEAYQLFKKMVPRKDKNNDTLLVFAGVLKPPQ